MVMFQVILKEHLQAADGKAEIPDHQKQDQKQIRPLQKHLA